MNAEISKIRKLRNLSDEFIYEPERIDKEIMTKKIYKLNSNMSELYFDQYRGNVKINDFINKFIENMYIVLDLFNEIGVYPDYFYQAIVDMNVKYKKIVNDNSVRGKYQVFRNTNLSVEAIETIKEGLKDQEKYASSSDYNISDAYYDMIIFFKEFNIPYGINTDEHIISSFNDINYNITSIMNQLSNSDDLFDDVECLARLLFDYISFFVAIGINPKQDLDDYIENIEKTKHR